jgi:hypothetical protein
MSSTPAPRPDGWLAALVPEGGGDGAAEMPIQSAVARIGQGAQNDVRLDDDTVSTQHARLEYDAGGWRLTDLESRNGTYIDGVRLAAGVPTPIAEGALLGIGAVKLTFITHAGADPEKARAEYAPAAAPTPIAERSTFRVPLWLFLLVVIVLAMLIGLFFWFGGDPGAGEPAVQALLRVSVHPLAPPPA